MRKGLLLFLFATALVAAAVVQAYAWTSPISLSASGNALTSVSRIAKGSNGSMHLAYRIKDNSNGWYIKYRYRASNGNWGGIENIGVSWADRPDILEDSQGRPHMFYTGTGVGGSYNDLFEAYKQNGSWVVTNFSNTTGYGEDYPRIGMDPAGRLHLIYFRTTDSGNNIGKVAYRRFDGSSWTAEEILGNIDTKAGYHRADMAVDTNGVVHVVWCQNQYTMVYRKFDGANWSAQQTIGTTSAYFSYPEIAAATPNNIVVVTFDQVTGSTYRLKYNCSSNGGSSWAALIDLNDGHYPSLESDNNGKAYLVYQGRPATGTTLYREWSGGTNWSSSVTITPTTSWQQLADVAIDSNGVQHVTYDDTPTSGAEVQISYIYNQRDLTAPSPVNGFVTLNGSGQARLDWNNPSETDFKGTKVLYKTTGYPTSPADGTLVCDELATAGSADYFVHTGLTNGTTYYYTAFAYDASGNYASGVNITAVPGVAKTNLLNNGGMDTFTGGVAGGWVSYKVNDPGGAIGFAPDTVNYVSSPSQQISGIDSYSLPSSGLTAAGVYQVISGVTPGKVYQFVSYTDIYNSTASSAGHRYLHNFGINTAGGTDPGTPNTDGTIGGAKWMTSSQAAWNDQAWSSVHWGGNLDYTSAAYPATSSAISVWAGVTIDNAGARDAAATVFNIDQCFLFEWDFAASAGLTNGNFEGARINLQDGQNPTNMTDGTDVIPAGWTPCGGGIGQSVYSNWTVLPEARRSGALGAEIKNRRGTTNRGLMQKITCSPGYTQTFTAWAKASGTDSTQASVGIDPYGGGDINSSNIVWQSTPSTSWTQLGVSVTSAARAVTVFLKTSNTNASGGSYQTGYFDDCSYSQGAAVNVGTISGFVRDSSGSAISGASVTTDGLGYSTTSAADGSYTLANVMSATYSVTAAKSGYTPYTYSSVAVTAGATVTRNFSLNAIPGSISGIVRDNAGSAIAGASVSTNTGGYSTATAADGSYAFANVTPGTYNITASKASYQNQTLSGVVVAPAQAVGGADLSLTPVERTIGECKSLALDTPVTIANALVTADFTNLFYIEEIDRFSGIGISWTGAVDARDKVSVYGKIAEISGERRVLANKVDVISHNNTIPTPLGLAGRTIGGAAYASQQGVKDGYGLSNIGLLIRTCGKVLSKGTGYVVIDDGSIAGVRVYTSYDPGTGTPYLIVTGISSCEVPAGESVPVSVIRATDVRVAN